MSKINTRGNVTQTSKNENSFWDTAISDAEKQIQDAKYKITHLKRAIESFRILRDSGEPFPLQNIGENKVNL